ncbi:MAG: SpoIIE family protein phosphatase [Pirellulales bacterium]
MIFSLRTKLVLAIAVPLLAAYLGMVWLEYRLGRQEALAGLKAQAIDLVARKAAELDGGLLAGEEVARTTARFLTLNPELSADQIKAMLQANLRGNPDIFGMCTAFEPNAFRREVAFFAPYYCRGVGGALRYVDIGAAARDYTKLDWYRPARVRNRPFWTEPYFDVGVGERLMCTLSAPFYRDERFRGLVTTDVLSADLLREIARIKPGSGYCILISTSGKFISHPDESLVMRESIFGLAERYGWSELAEMGRQMVAGKEGVIEVRDGPMGQPAWAAYAPVASPGWSLAAIIPENEVMAPVRARMARSLGVLLAGLAVILAIVLLVSNRMTRPIARLTEAAESLARGNFEARVTGIRGRDEVGRLAETFNTMVADLKANIDGRIREEAARHAVEGELRTARQIQASLLPRPLGAVPEKELSLHAVNAPAKFIAGDFFDFFFLDENRLALVIADVSGKGAPAALYMAVTRTRLRDFAFVGGTPAEVVGKVNRGLADGNEQCMFVTLFLGYYDVRTGELVYANAGHNPPYVVRQDGTWETLEPTGPLAAVFPDAVFRDAQCRLARGELLVLFTDGVTEAFSGDGDLFGEGRLEALLDADARQPVAAVCEAIVQAVDAFSQGDLKDDVTVLALRRDFEQPGDAT